MEQCENIVSFTLNNGVKVILSKADSRASYVGLFVASGSRNDGECGGISHLIEHMIFKGTSKYSYVDMMDYIESVGGEMNAYTSKEETCLQISIMNDYVERAMRVLGEIFFDSVFPAGELKKEKSVVVDEIESYEDVPSETIYDEFERMLFDGGPLAGDVLGTKKSVRAISREDIVSAYERLYVPSQLVVSYVGPLNLSLVSEFVCRYFDANVRCENKVEKLNLFVPRETKFDLTRNKKTHQSHCVIGGFAPSLKDELRLPSALLANILGGVSFNALLNLQLREERGLTYNIEANYSPYSDTGVFNVYFGTDYSKVETCKNVIFDLFNKIVNEGLPEQQLESYKRQLIGQFSVSEDNYMSLMLNNAKSFWWYNGVDSLQEVTGKILSVNNDTLKQVAKLILDVNAMNVLIYK